MKKLDLHIHTKKSESDYPFDLSIDKLKEYVAQMEIDGIAITNHNLFDKDQFFVIQNELKDICVVLPGIEIDLGIKSDGHILCITTQDDIDDFSQKCDKINELIKEQNDFVKYDKFKSIFTDLGKYLWIPHYDKDPILDKEIIKDYPTLDCDILKAGHHGSKTSSSLDFLKTVTPDTAIISVGYKNHYGHPDKEVIARLESLNIEIRRTDVEGTITYQKFVMPKL